jgi:transcriptional regulator with XRE-family HTH domain
MAKSEAAKAGLDSGPTTSTGVSELDRALGGLYWGDNVVWEPDDDVSAQPFYAAIAHLAPRYEYAAYVSLRQSPEDVTKAYPGLAVVDARPGSDLHQAGPLLNSVRQTCIATKRDLLLFDGLELMVRDWGVETARRFFTRCCPMLLELGAIAYWSLPPAHTPQPLRRAVEEVTQCVIAVGDGRVRIAKAEGRPPGVQGSVFRYKLDDHGRPNLAAAPAAARLGAALRAVRIQRGLSQSELARVAGVSPSAISQAERGRRGLSLETLLDLTARLNITLDELLRGEVAPGYRLARRHNPRAHADGRPLALLDDPNVGLRAYLLRLPEGESASLGFNHKGVEIVAVASGLVQVVLPSGRPVLRPGETLLTERSEISACRNIGEREAMVFWILRDGHETQRGSSE